MGRLRSLLAAGGLALAFIAAVSGAKADAVTYPITWNVSGTLDDGGILSGFFQINQYGYTNGTNWSLLTTTGTLLDGYSYSPGINASNPNVFTVKFTPNDHVYEVLLQLTFVNSLLLPSVNPMIVGNLGPSFECLGWTCPNGGATRYFTSGVASAVPVPAALPLFAGGLGLLGWMARRRRRHSEGTIAI
jgi:hypothetical protein